MRKGGSRLGFLPEALRCAGAADQFLTDQLGGDVALQRGIARRVHRAHAATPDTSVEAIAAGKQARRRHYC